MLALYRLCTVECLCPGSIMISCCVVKSFGFYFRLAEKKHQRVDFWIFWCGSEAQGGSLVDRLIPMDTSEDSSDSCPSSGLGVAVGEDLEQIEEDLQQLKTDIIEQAVDDTRKRSAQDEVFQSLSDRVFCLEVQLVFEEQARREWLFPPPGPAFQSSLPGPKMNKGS